MNRRKFLKKSLERIVIICVIGSIPLISNCVHNPFDSENPVSPVYNLETKTKIIFGSKQDKIEEIYVMNPDGSNQTRLTYNNFSNSGYPSWSPDGSKIAFMLKNDIYVINADGSNQIRLSDGISPSWSPDGSKIAFMSWRNNIWDIYVMNADGSNQTNLSNNPASDGHPSWSPDGSKIVFHAWRDGINTKEIYIMNADGSNQTRLTYSGGEEYPSWSPDGKMLAFTSRRNIFPEIYIMNADGSNQTRLTYNSAETSHPSWSPDCTKIVYISDVYARDNPTEEEGFFTREIYTINSDGSDQKRLTFNSVSEYDPAWSPFLK